MDAQRALEVLLTLTAQLRVLRENGEGAIGAYVRNAKLGLRRKTRQLVVTDGGENL